MGIRLINYVNNQLQTPALYTAALAQRPTYGIYGRLFMSSDTKEIYQDLATSWQLLADAGAGAGTLQSVTHNGNTTTWGINILGGDLTLQATQKLYVLGLANGGVLFPSGGSGLISQDTTNFVWDNTNKYLGIGTNTPSAPFDIHSGSNVMQQLNSTGTNNSFLAFLNQDIGKWRIGNLYGGGNNDMVIYDTANSTYRAYFTNTGYTILPNSVIIGSSSRSSSYVLDVTGSGNFSAGLNAGFFNATTATIPANGMYLSAANTLNFATNTTNRLTIASTGAATFTNTLACNGALFQTNQWELFPSAGASNRAWAFNVSNVVAGDFTISSGSSATGGTYAIKMYFAATTGNVMINSATDSGYKLDVNGTIRTQSNLYVSGTATISNNVTINAPTSGIALKSTGISGQYAAYFQGDTTASNSFGAIISGGTNSNDSALIVRNASNSTELCKVRGDGLFQTGTSALSPYNYGVTAGPVACYISNAGSLGYNASIRESKTNIVNIENVDWLKKLTAVNFNKRKVDDEGNYLEEFENELNYGLIAEEVEEINPDMVFYTNDGKLKGVHYDRLITPILKLVQELNEKLVRNNIN